MPLYRPSELKAFLNSLEEGNRPKKSLGQNFLIDGNIIRKIVDLSKVEKGDCVVEIGPGPGVLTEALLEKGCEVFAIERDRRFARALRRLGAEEQLHIFEEDVLQIDWKKMLGEKKAHVVANIPYNITSPIIERIFDNRASLFSATLMVQKEVGERMVAKERTKERSSLSLFCEFYSHISYGFTVSNKSFYPPPKVDSAVVRFQLKKENDPLFEKQFFAFVHSIFCYKRKMVQTTLKKNYPLPLIEESYTKLSLSSTVRPQELSLEEWIALFHAMH